jgi:hypothetical protein
MSLLEAGAGWSECRPLTLYTFPSTPIQDVLVKQGDRASLLYALTIAVAGLHVAT